MEDFVKDIDVLISRQATIEAVKQYIAQFDAIDANFLDGMKTAINIVKELPSAERKGRWLKAYADHEAFGVRPFSRYCSGCNETTVFKYNYCPNCGARMEEVES